MTFAERAARIAELERRHAESSEMIRAQSAACEAQQRAFDLALQACVDVITAPWRALAEDLRR